VPAHTPDFDTFRRLCREGNLIPVCREVMADLDTPVAAYLKLARGPYAFLLESVEGGERWARYSFLSADPRVVIRGRGDKVTVVEDGVERELAHDGNPIMAVRAYMVAFRPVAVPDLPPFTGGAVGYVGYDMVRFFDAVPLAPDKPGALGLDDFCFVLTDRLVVFDAARQVIQVIVNAHTEGRDPKAAYDEAVATIDKTIATLRAPAAPRKMQPSAPDAEPVTSNVTRERFEDMVRAAKEYIRAGDIFQVVLSQRFATPLGCDPVDLYRALRRINPSPYMYHLRFGDTEVVGASPELLVRTREGQVEVRPIAGTRPRGRTQDADRALEQELLADPKECAEHLMLVDLGRNDVGRVAQVGTVAVDDFMVVERYSHVMHLVSHVAGGLAEGRDAFDVLVACFPAGTLSGAPKIRAMQIIEELEPTPRGLYGGAVGYFGFDGSSDMAINIRTVVVHDGVAYLQAGAGIVADSDPAREFAETESKALGPVRALEMARRGLD